MFKSIESKTDDVNSDDKPKKIDNSETAAADATEAKVPQAEESGNEETNNTAETSDDADSADPEIPDDLDVLKGMFVPNFTNFIVFQTTFF